MTAWRQQIDNNITHSTASTTYANGSTDLQDHLEPIFDPRDGSKVVGHLVPSAAKSWNAMAAHAWRDGVLLLPTSSADTFRPLAVQKSIFTDRYRTADQGNGSRVCNGKRWYLRKGQATAACPGTSNHGRAEAVDFRRLAGTLLWMEKHARSYGWAWELASEEWHVHYLLGDAVPKIVNSAAPVPQPNVQEDDDMPKIYSLDSDCSVEGTPYPKGWTYLLIGNVRRHLNAGTDFDETVKMHGPVIPINAVAFGHHVASTANDMIGLRGLPPEQRGQLVEIRDTVVGLSKRQSG